MKIYVVAKGKETGFFFDWDIVFELVNRYPGAKFKKFSMVDDAIEYMKKF